MGYIIGTNSRVGSMLERIIEPKKGIPTERQRFSNRQLLMLITPTIIEQLLTLLVGVADTIMISYIGETAVSGVSLVDQLNNVFIMVFIALASGGSVVASQYIGNKDKENGILAASQLIMLTGLISVIITAVLLCRGTEIFRLLFGRAERDVENAGLLYLRITACSMPFLGVYNSCAGLFRSMGKVKTIMYVSVMMNVINVVGNAIGLFILHAGIAGVAYPSLLSRVFAAAVMLCLSLNPKLQIHILVSKIFKWERQMAVRILRIAVPGGVENFLFQASKVALSAIVTTFGTMQIAAYGVALSFWSMAGLFVSSMGPVFITVVGQYMGAGDKTGAEYYMHKLLRISNLGSILWNTSFLIVTPLVLLLYDLSENTVALLMVIIVLHNVFNALLCPTAFAFPNGLRAAGDVTFTMAASILSTVVIRVLLSAIFGIYFKLGVIGITLAMICDWTLKAILILWRYHGGKWKNYRVI